MSTAQSLGDQSSGDQSSGDQSSGDQSSGDRFVACRRLLACLLALATLGGCAPGGDLQPMPRYDGQIYHLGVDDQVRIITYGADQLSDAFRVDDAGDIDLPLLGSVPAAGLTTHALAARISDQLKSKNLLKNPSVSVEIIAYRPVFILGQVNKPGQYPYLPGMSVLSAVAIAGGYTYRAYEKYAGIVRSSETSSTTGRGLPQDFVAPGDVITVYERPF